MDKALLIIMAKWHAFGRCKTRLSKDIGKSNSAKVQSLMTKHTISVAKFLQENKLIDISIAISGLGLGNCKRWTRELGIKKFNLPISLDNLVLHLPKACHFAMMISNALSKNLLLFKIIISVSYTHLTLPTIGYV